MERRLERFPDEAKIGGVCAGLAHYFKIDVALVRALFVIGIFLPHCPAAIIYIILWIALPERSFGTTYSQSTLYANPSFSMYASNQKPQGSIIGGVVLIILGVLFLLDRWFNIDFGDLWPLILIAIGVWLIFKDRIKPPYDNNTYNNPTNYNNPTDYNSPSNPGGTL